MDREKFDSNRQIVTTSQGDISVVRVGNGPPALFVHGLMLNGSVWRGVATELQSARDCVIPDLLAHGRTRVAEEQDLSIATQADMLAELCDVLGFAEVDVVANDFGGAVAQTLTVNNPQIVRSLTLTNCDVHYNLGPPTDIRRIVPFAQAESLGETIEAMLNKPELARTEFPGKGFEDPSNLSEELIDELIAPGVSSAVAKRAFERFVLSVRGDELAQLEPKLRTCNVPTYLVWGTDDPYFGLPWAYWLRDILPSFAGLTEISGASLFAPIERPAEVASAIERFWQSVA